MAQRNACILIASYVRMWKHRKKFLAMKRTQALAKAQVVVAA